MLYKKFKILVSTSKRARTLLMLWNFWNKRRSKLYIKNFSICFLRLSHEEIFSFPRQLQERLSWFHHEVAWPHNRVVTRETCLLSKTSLNSRNSSTITSRSRRSSGCAPPWNSGMSSLMHEAHRASSPFMF